MAGFRATVRADMAMWARPWGRDPGFGLLWRLLLTAPGFRLVLWRRIGEALPPMLRRPFNLLLWPRISRRYGCYIDPRCPIGPGLYLPHPIAIVVGRDCTIGRNVTILQSVTLGRRQVDVPSGPTIGDGVQLSAGCIVLGDVEIGAGAVVAAGAVVSWNVPPGAVAGSEAEPLPRLPRRAGT